MDSSTISSISQDDFDGILRAETATRERTFYLRSYARDGYAYCARHAKSYLKPGLRREIASWVLVTVVGSSLMFALFYLFAFIWLPAAQYTLGSHNFISEYGFSEGSQPIDGLKRWEEDFSRSVIPIMCHSHNDYWRPYPLFSALAAGCVGVEADVWLNEDGTDLLVGHDSRELKPERTLKKMYLDPLFHILEKHNPEEHWANHTVYDRAFGVFPTQPNTTLVLLIDVKTEPQKTWDLVHEQLEPLRRKQFLTRHEHVYPKPGFIERQSIWPGPVVVVGTGNMDRDEHFTAMSKTMAQFEFEGAPEPRRYYDYFYDAPLDTLPQHNTFEFGDGWWASSQIDHAGVAYYASTSFNQAIGSVRTGFSEKQLGILREQVRIAKLSKLKARYWDLPSWPINYRDYVWDVLTREGVDMLSVDDLESASKRGWSRGYIGSVIWMSLASVWLVATSAVTLWVIYKLLRQRVEAIRSQENRIRLT